MVDDAHDSKNSVEKMKSVVACAWLFIEQVHNATASACLKFHLAPRFRFCADFICSSEKIAPTPF